MEAILIIAKQAVVKSKWFEALKLGYEVYARDSLAQDQDFQHYDLLILDSDFFDHKQISFTKIKHFGTKVLIMGEQWPEAQQINALSAGAVGYCDASVSEGIILKAVDCVMQNDIWIKRHLFHLVIGALSRELIKSDNMEIPKSDDVDIRLASLSEREKEVACLIRKGVSNKFIAATLLISERTVKAHLTSIFTKLQVTNRLHLGLTLKELE